MREPFRRRPDKAVVDSLRLAAGSPGQERRIRVVPSFVRVARAHPPPPSQRGVSPKPRDTAAGDRRRTGSPR
jgi:hypothetical protein